MAKPKRNQNVKIARVNKPPAYLKSLTDNPSPGRLGSSVETRSDIFRVDREINFTMDIIGGSGEYLYVHTLGFVPFVRGSYIIESGSSAGGTDYPIGLRGLLPEDRYPEYGTAVIHNVQVTEADVNTITIKASLSGFVGRLRFKALLFREDGAKD